MTIKYLLIYTIIAFGIVVGMVLNIFNSFKNLTMSKALKNCSWKLFGFLTFLADKLPVVTHFVKAYYLYEPRKLLIWGNCACTVCSSKVCRAKEDNFIFVSFYDI